MKYSLIHLAVRVGASLGFIWFAMQHRLLLSTRLTLGVLWALIGIVELLTGKGEYDRLIGAAQLASAYVMLMPFLPWHRDSEYTKRVTGHEKG